jgi:hypothetical protein
VRRTAAAWERPMDGGPPVRPVSEEEAKSVRPSPGLVRSLRARLGLSQLDLARLIGPHMDTLESSFIRVLCRITNDRHYSTPLCQYGRDSDPLEV